MKKNQCIVELFVVDFGRGTLYSCSAPYFDYGFPFHSGCRGMFDLTVNAHSQQTSWPIRITRTFVLIRFFFFFQIKIDQKSFQISIFSKTKLFNCNDLNRMCRNSIDGRCCSYYVSNCNSIIHLLSASEFDDAEGRRHIVSLLYRNVLFFISFLFCNWVLALSLELCYLR